MKAEQTGGVVLELTHVEAEKLFEELERTMRQSASLGTWLHEDHIVCVTAAALAKALRRKS